MPVGGIEDRPQMSRADGDHARRRRERLFGVTALLLGFCGALILIEVGLRIADYPFPGRWIPSENALAQFDPDVGWSYIPNRSIAQTFDGNPTPIAMHFNDIGARVGQPGHRFDAAAPTVVFVGDSFVFGHGVIHEESLPGQFERNSGLPFQTVNLGVQGYGTDQALLLLKRHYGRFNTKVVVCDFLMWHVARNDNADRRLLRPDVKILGTKPRFALRPDGTLVEVEKAARYEDRLELRLWQLGQLAWAKHFASPDINLTRALMRDLKHYVEARGASFILILWMNRHSGGEEDSARALFPGLHLNVIDTGVDAPADWDSWRVSDGVHPDARANARVARLVADKIRQLGLPS